MDFIRHNADLRGRITREKRAGKTIGFVPTMGFLHDGHITLVREAKKKSDFVVVSIFVNPTQFGPQEDFSRYPRDLEGDLEKLKGHADLVFAPTTEEMLVSGAQTQIDVVEVAKGLCGAHRPGHFQGVAGVVAKLFHLVTPDYAFFGEKDYQQLQVIRRMVKDLLFPVQIVGLATVRDRDGLAMSSRNAYLSAEERQFALHLPQTLEILRKKTAKGVFRAKDIASEALELLRRETRIRVEYVEVVHPDDLTPVEEVGEGKPALLAVALYVANVRLIDNCFLGREP